MEMVNRKNLELLALGQRVCRNHIQALRLNVTGLSRFSIFSVKLHLSRAHKGTASY